jgi:hypothetical protein
MLWNMPPLTGQAPVLYVPSEFLTGTAAALYFLAACAVVSAVLAFLTVPSRKVVTATMVPGATRVST